MLALNAVNRLALEASANALIVNALTHGAPGFPVPLQGEVKAAHATVIAGASQVAAAWGPVVAPHGYAVTSRAVLIHGTPIVEFFDSIAGRQERRELGDLLLVVDAADGAGVVDRRAALVQAKLATKTGHLTLGPSGNAQRNLYLRWPAFTLPAGYAAHQRDLNDARCPGSAIDGCRFGGIDLLGTPRDWTQILTAQRMNARGKPGLGTSLMHMACGSAGREATAGGGDPWSDLVNELMAVTFGERYPASSGPKRSWQTASFLLAASSAGRQTYLQTAFFEDARSPSGERPGEGEPEPIGISTIHVEFRASADRG